MSQDFRKFVVRLYRIASPSCEYIQKLFFLGTFGIFLDITIYRGGYWRNFDIQEERNEKQISFSNAFSLAAYYNADSDMCKRC